MATAVNSMVGKRSTAQSGGGESSESQQVSGDYGGGAPPQQPQQQGGRGYSPQHQAGGNQGRASSGGGSGSQRSGMASQQYYGGASQYIQQQGRGTTQQQQHYGGPSEYYQPQGRGTQQQQQHPQQQPGGGQQHGGGGGGGFVPSTNGPSGPFNPELHQANQALHQAGVMTQPLPYVKSTGMVEPEARSLSFVPKPTSQVNQQFQQLSVQQEGSFSEIVRPIPASSKSLGFPLRPGRGSFGSRCIVKANYFFAELPDKDLHQYDVSLPCPVIYVYILVFISENFISIQHIPIVMMFRSPLLQR